MADWDHPQLGDPYVNVPDLLNGKDEDAITLLLNAATNLPNGAFKYDRARDLFQEWNGASFDDRVLSIIGGGTGAGSAGAARSNLGLGSMATQNATGVAITGGSISGITLDAATITSGIIALARGGTGASLTIGASNEFLQSNGATIVFGHNGANLTGLNASNLSAGTVPLARLPAGVGRFIQLLQTTTAANQVITVNSAFQAVTALQVTITPASINNRILIRVVLQAIISINSATHQAFFQARIVRNGATVVTFANVNRAGPNGLGSDVKTGYYTFEYLDSPASLAALTYQVQLKGVNDVGASGALFVNSGALIGGEPTTSVITVEEIGPN